MLKPFPMSIKIAKQTADEWKTRFKFLDNREEQLNKYSTNYLALKSLLDQYACNAFTIDCAFLPDVEYVPCVAASLLIDQGCGFGCEGDINQLIMQRLLQGSGGKNALMGNLFENATHKDILENTIVINHDVLPPSMACPGIKINFRDFHETGKGSTLIADIPRENITMGGISYNSDSIWLSRGKVVWSEDTVHCRLSVGIKVENAKRIMKESFGHHQVFSYGDCYDALKLAAQFLKMRIVEL